MKIGSIYSASAKNILFLPSRSFLSRARGVIFVIQLIVWLMHDISICLSFINHSKNMPKTNKPLRLIIDQPKWLVEIGLQWRRQSGAMSQAS
jgi:hypothetical protein